MVSVRNPLAGFGITILGTVALSFLVGIPILFLPHDLAYFYFPFALFAVGVFSGRTTFIGSLGFMGALIGGIVGVYAFQALFLPAGWPLTAGVPVWLTGVSFITVLLFGAACGLGGAASRMPSDGAPLPSWSRLAMISRTFDSASSGSLGASSFAGDTGSGVASLGSAGSRYSGKRYRSPSASIAV